MAEKSETKDKILDLLLKLSLRRSTLNKLNLLAQDRGFNDLNDYIKWLLLSDLNGTILTEMDFEPDVFPELSDFINPTPIDKNDYDLDIDIDIKQASEISKTKVKQVPKDTKLIKFKKGKKETKK